MATQTQSASPPEITILNRVYSIPLIGSSIDTINSTLASNSYTSTPYSTAKELSASAYKFSEPFQVRLAPLIVRADGIANKAVDVVESRYPYPFKAKPEEVVNYVRERRESSEKYVRERRDSAYKTIDDNVKSPAFTYAQAIDQVSRVIRSLLCCLVLIFVYLAVYTYHRLFRGYRHETQPACNPITRVQVSIPTCSCPVQKSEG
jgi:hypothetical protein